MSQETGTKTTIDRPLPITALCLMSGVIIGLTLGKMLSLFVSGHIPFWLFAWWTTSLTLGGLSMLGLWRMKRWGVWIYLGAMAANLAVNAILGKLPLYLSRWQPWMPIGFLVAIMLYYYRRMD